MDSVEILRQQIVFLFHAWLHESPSPAEGVRRLQSIAPVGTKSFPLLMISAGDQILILDVHRMDAAFLGPVEWQPAVGTLGIPRPKDGTR